MTQWADLSERCDKTNTKVGMAADVAESELGAVLFILKEKAMGCKHVANKVRYAKMKLSNKFTVGGWCKPFSKLLAEK